MAVFSMAALEFLRQEYAFKRKILRQKLCNRIPSSVTILMLFSLKRMLLVIKNNVILRQ